MLLFYRGGWCPVCNLQLSALQRDLAQFEGQNAQIIAISNDSTETGQELQQKHSLGFEVLVGLTPEIIAAYDLFYNPQRGHAEPAVFILRPDGTIAYVNLVSGPRGRPSNEDLLSILSRI